MMRRFLAALLLPLLFAAQLSAATRFSTSFTGADEDPLSEGGVWDVGYTGFANVKRAGNEARTSTDNTAGQTTYNAVTLANDQWVLLTLGSWVGGTGLKLGVGILRAQSPAAGVDSYQCVARLTNAGGDTSRIAKTVAGVGTNLVTEAATTWASGDTNYCEAINTAIALKRNGAALLNTTDNGLTSGRAGLTVRGVVSTDAGITDLSAGDFCPSALALLGVGC